MVFFIEINKDKEKAINLYKELTDFLYENKHEITDKIEKANFILSLGGDGTFIRTTNKYRKYGKPILGINCGTLGYLTELNPDNYKEKLLELFNNNYTVHNRIGIEGNIGNIKKEACNDIYIRNNSMSVVDFHVLVDNNYLAAFKADGVIISTPMGSTGYALSCGGSFVDPDSDVILLNLIAPHTLMNRSIVLNSNSEIKIIMDEVRGNCEIAIDGDIVKKLNNKDEVIIKKSNISTKIIEINKRSFINLISSKLTNN